MYYSNKQCNLQCIYIQCNILQGIWYGNDMFKIECIHSTHNILWT